MLSPTHHPCSSQGNITRSAQSRCPPAPGPRKLAAATTLPQSRPVAPCAFPVSILLSDPELPCPGGEMLRLPDGTPRGTPRTPRPQTPRLLDTTPPGCHAPGCYASGRHASRMPRLPDATPPRRHASQMPHLLDATPPRRHAPGHHALGSATLLEVQAQRDLSLGSHCV